MISSARPGLVVLELDPSEARAVAAAMRATGWFTQHVDILIAAAAADGQAGDGPKPATVRMLPQSPVTGVCGEAEPVTGQPEGGDGQRLPSPGAAPSSGPHLQVVRP